MDTGIFSLVSGSAVVREGVRALRERIRKTVQIPSVRAAETRMLADLGRLAEVSPHLLADIGFEEQAADAPGTRVWTRGGLRVVQEA